jgi:hypothetical protein
VLWKCPCGELLALEAHVLDVLRVPGRIDRRDHAIESEAQGPLRIRIDAQALGCAVEVSGRSVPLLAFAVVHRKLDHVTVRPAERLVYVHQRLHEVLARGNIRKPFDGIAERGPIEDRALSGLEPVHVHPEDLLALERGIDLEAGLLVPLRREHDQEPPIDRLVSNAGWKADLEAERGRRVGREREDGEEDRSVHEAHGKRVLRGCVPVPATIRSPAREEPTWESRSPRSFWSRSERSAPCTPRRRIRSW